MHLPHVDRVINWNNTAHTGAVFVSWDTCMFTWVWGGVGCVWYCRYLGKKVAKRKIRKMNEKKFVFDWEGSEDTSVDYNPIYSGKHEAQLFGRGHIAGIDVVSQKKLKSKFYDDLLQTRRTREEKCVCRCYFSVCCSLVLGVVVYCSSIPCFLVYCSLFYCQLVVCYFDFCHCSFLVVNCSLFCVFLSIVLFFCVTWSIVLVFFPVPARYPLVVCRGVCCRPCYLAVLLTVSVSVYLCICVSLPM